MNYIVYLCWLMCTVAFVCGTLETLELADTASMFREIKTITHDAEKREVVITMANYRRCDKPIFRIRLSGMSLDILELVGHEGSTHEMKGVNFQKPRHSVYFYKYSPIIDDGTYFIEVIVLYCTAVNPDNFKELCLEEALDGRNVLTRPYSFTVTASQASKEVRPRWLLANNDSASYKLAILQTRYQNRDCDYADDCVSTDLPQFNLYDWTDQPKYAEKLRAVFALDAQEKRKNGIAHVTTDVKSIIMCMFGTSHERLAVDYASQLHIPHVQWVFIETRYPGQFDFNIHSNMHCTYSVFGYGQWSLSDREYPANRKEFADGMRTFVARAKVPTSNPHQSQLFLQSMNYNGLGAAYTACPSLDHRTPPFVDLYNDIIRNVSIDSPFEYIDLNHIMAPLWDSAWDWCHPSQKIFNAEVEWVLHFALQSSLTRHRAPPIHVFTFPADNALVRFADSRSVYLYKDGAMREFPNGGTFMKMGFQFGEVQTMVAMNRGYFKFGDQLPSL